MTYLTWSSRAAEFQFESRRSANITKKFKARPWHKEGFENAEWILLDYVDVVVHIFREDRREFYQLEKLWADAKITTHEYKE